MSKKGNYFAYIANTLVSWGYKRGKNLVGAPFDWRKSPLELLDFYATLKSLIQRVYYYNHETPVVILGHSMGNPVMNYFYHKYVDAEWKKQFIKSHISLAGAWGGSLQIVKLFASGYNMDYFRMNFFAITAEKNYSAHNVKEFFADIDYRVGLEQYNLANPTLILESPGVETHCIYGSKVNTPESFTWAKGYFPNYQPSITFGDGDGTVNIRSLKFI
uniref:Lecithin:cholesterol acyltransferase n=1 Tax=Panagrolaimus superbus TaxID=310955 RepID=A0A914Y4V9_9BILA